MARIMRVVAVSTVIVVVLAGCAATEGDEGATPETTAPRSTTMVVPTTTTTTTPTTTTTTSSTTTSTTTTTVPEPTDLDRDRALIEEFYDGWNRAVEVGTAEIEGYLNAHLYPELPKCQPGEKSLAPYTLVPGSIERSYDWKITWGPLDGTTPEGRTYEVQLEEREDPSHVTILHGVAYVFWNCRGETSSSVDTYYEVDAPTYTPAALPGSGGAAGSGCSPGSGPLPDGIWFGFISGRSIDEITFDLACIWPDKTIDEGFITNTSDRLRTVPVDPAATAYQVTGGTGGVAWAPVPYSVWLTAPPDPTLCAMPWCSGAWLYVNDGAVTELVQLFFP